MGQSNESALPLSEAAKHLVGISEWRLREAAKAGVVPSTKYGGRYFLFPSDLKASPLGQYWRDMTPASSWKGDQMVVTSR